ncbi:MAG: class I SAM-dependent methyltransferase [Acidimicrobiaceae bacterium]|nr:class I SAM-dependent methyltransferase [Acidimicrobiaceae bacterium]
MSRNSSMPQDIVAYAAAHSTQPDEVQQALIAATNEKTKGFSGMQIGTDQGVFMTLLTTVLQVEFAVEVGTFTGYSALCIARGLAPGGRLLCCDISEEWTSIGREHWETAGVADRIDLQIAPAIETLRSLPPEPKIDLAFIDADKTGYMSYYEEILPRLSARGVILVDNTIWYGMVLEDSGAEDADTVALRAFNDHVVADERVEAVLLTVGDGVTLIRRR